MHHARAALAAIAACAGVTLVGGAQMVAAQPAATSPSAAFDKHFVMEAAQGNYFEVGAGRLATQNAASAVCKAGKALASDHQRAQTALRGVGRQLKAAFPRAPSPVQSWLLAELASTVAKGGGTANANAAACTASTGDDQGAGFNKMWLGIEVANHLQDLAMYTQAAGATKSTALRNYVCKQLPVLREHLQMLKQAMKDSGVSVATAAAPPPAPSACK